MPVWVTPRGATVVLSADGRLAAVDRRTGQPADWELVMPEHVLAPELPWSHAASGMLGPRPGLAVIPLRPGPGGEASGIMSVPRRRYYEIVTLASLARVPAGMFAAGVQIDPAAQQFSLYSFGGQLISWPLAELAEVLGRYGRRDGQAIVLIPAYSAEFHTDGFDDAIWDALVAAFAAVARTERVQVFYPDPTSAAWVRYGDFELAAYSEGPRAGRWEHADPGLAPGTRPEQPRFVQDVAGRLRDESDSAVVSLVMDDDSLDARPRRLKVGVASPTAEMMGSHGSAYDRVAGDGWQAVFLVDLPLADGHLALAYPEDQVRPAAIGEVAELIRRGGWTPAEQVIQLLAAPLTSQEHEVFRAEAQELAEALRRDVFIVAGPGLSVRYDQARGTFVAEGAAGQAASWLQLPGSEPAEGAQPPGYFLTDSGALVRRDAGQRLHIFGNLYSLEPAGDVEARRDEYEHYVEYEGGGLPLVVAGTRLGAVESVALARDLIARLALAGKPVRLLIRRLDGTAPEDGNVLRFASDLAEATGATVYLAQGHRYSTSLHNFTADRWMAVEPPARLVRAGAALCAGGGHRAAGAREP